MIGRAEIHRAVADERAALVKDLEGLDAADWDRPSLCEGWAVRDVVGHMLRLERIYRYSFPFFAGLVRYGLRVNTYLREDARRCAAGRAPDDLIAALSSTSFETGPFARWHPIAAVPLSEVIIHGQDIREPLGIDHRFDVERLEPIANLLKRRLGIFGRGKRPSGLRFEATDADWAWGRGETVRAPLYGIVMRLAGRRVAST